MISNILIKGEWREIDIDRRLDLQSEEGSSPILTYTNYVPVMLMP